MSPIGSATARRRVAIVGGGIAGLFVAHATPDVVRIIRHLSGIPQYTVGHLDRLARAEASLARLPGAVLAGNAYRGVAINSCIADAQPVASRVLKHCAVVHAPARAATSVV